MQIRKSPSSWRVATAPPSFPDHLHSTERLFIVGTGRLNSFRIPRAGQPAFKPLRREGIPNQMINAR
ncbi:hypothetical protein ASZ90_010525 [hydrocarbon metagenome]|uniref:Uncharacterized protein n=1 Tax=hydrocarbon metagenome TaxID=938273 RepID=A0A0W8FGB4_9ZZZZ